MSAEVTVVSTGKVKYNKHHSRYCAKRVHYQSPLSIAGEYILTISASISYSQPFEHALFDICTNDSQ